MKDSSTGNGSEPSDVTAEFGGSDDYVTTTQLVKIIELSRPATLRMLQSKKILGYRVGDRWRVKKTEVRRFLQNGNHPDHDKE